MLELRGGLPIGREALRHSEPHHSLNKATPSYYTKNESFASGISKMWCVFWFPPVGGIYRAVGEFHRHGGGGNSPSGGWVAKPRGRPANEFSLHQLSSPPWPSPSCVDMCPWSFALHQHKSWPAGNPLGPLVTDLCTLPPRVRYILRVTLILVEFKISLWFLEILQFSTYVPEIK
jgi:hypothetical protein